MKYYDSGSLQTDDGAAIISQVHSTGFACVCLCVCVCFLIRCEQKAGRVARCRTFGERTVGDGDVQLALPGHLPRFVDGVLRCRNTTTGLLFTARSHADTHSLQLQMKDNSGGEIFRRAMLHSCCTGCLPSAEVLLCHCEKSVDLIIDNKMCVCVCVDFTAQNWLEVTSFAKVQLPLSWNKSHTRTFGRESDSMTRRLREWTDDLLF